MERSKLRFCTGLRLREELVPPEDNCVSLPGKIEMDTRCQTTAGSTLWLYMICSWSTSLTTLHLVPAKLVSFLNRSYLFLSRRLHLLMLLLRMCTHYSSWLAPSQSLSLGLNGISLDRPSLNILHALPFLLCNIQLYISSIGCNTI